MAYRTEATSENVTESLKKVRHSRVEMVVYSVWMLVKYLGQQMVISTEINLKKTKESPMKAGYSGDAMEALHSGVEMTEYSVRRLLE